MVLLALALSAPFLVAAAALLRGFALRRARLVAAPEPSSPPEPPAPPAELTLEALRADPRATVRGRVLPIWELRCSDGRTYLRPVRAIHGGALSLAVPLPPGLVVLRARPLQPKAGRYN